MVSRRGGACITSLCAVALLGMERNRDEEKNAKNLRGLAPSSRYLSTGAAREGHELSVPR